MRGFAVLLAMAVVVGVMACGLSAIAGGESDSQYRTESELFGVADESLDAIQVGHQGVLDPGGYCGTQDHVASYSDDNLACAGKPLRRLGNGVKRLLTFTLRC